MFENEETRRVPFAGHIQPRRSQWAKGGMRAACDFDEAGAALAGHLRRTILGLDLFSVAASDA